MSILDMTIEELTQVRRWSVEDLPMDGGNANRIAIYRRPVMGHAYVLGFDSAHGMMDGDFDAVTVADRNTSPWEEVACAHGRWGETLLHKIVYALTMLYDGAFVIGERQVGLTTLRLLHDEYKYTWLYYDKDEKKAFKPMSDILGHATVASDITLTDLRRAVKGHATNPIFRIYDKPSLMEIEKMQWSPRGARQQQLMLMGRRTVPDSALKAGAPSGLHDDLVISKALTLKGLNAVVSFDEPASKFPPGSMGSRWGDLKEFIAKKEEAASNPEQNPFAQRILAEDEEEPEDNW